MNTMSKTFTYFFATFLTLFLCTSNCLAFYKLPNSDIDIVENGERLDLKDSLITAYSDYATSYMQNNCVPENSSLQVSWYRTETYYVSNGFLPAFLDASLITWIWIPNTQWLYDTNTEPYPSQSYFTNEGGNYPYAQNEYAYLFLGLLCWHSAGVYDYHVYGYNVFYFDNDRIMAFGEPDEPVNGACGDADGNIYSYPPDEPLDDFDDWCNTGSTNTGDIVYYGDKWVWHCYGINGGTDATCEAYNSEPVDALCGLYEGNYYDNPPTEAEDFCELGTLIFPTFVETTLGWSWSCAGYNGGDNANCVAYKNIGSLPELPEQDDCSLQDIPDRWFCEISNSLKSIFLPDAEKINELQETINRINGRFPFNYLSVARNNFDDLQNNTNNDTITISLLDNEGTLNIDAVEPIADATKTASQGLFIFGFMFWAIGYIKHFFN